MGKEVSQEDIDKLKKLALAGDRHLEFPAAYKNAIDHVNEGSKIFSAAGAASHVWSRTFWSIDYETPLYSAFEAVEDSLIDAISKRLAGVLGVKHSDVRLLIEETTLEGAEDLTYMLDDLSEQARALINASGGRAD